MITAAEQLAARNAAEEFDALESGRANPTKPGGESGQSVNRPSKSGLVVGPVGADNGSAINFCKWHLEMRDSYLSAAKSWRNLAHTAHIDGDQETMIFAHTHAIENEAWANDAEAKARACV